MMDNTFMGIDMEIIQWVVIFFLFVTKKSS
jgi:hypothetical protein